MKRIIGLMLCFTMIFALFTGITAQTDQPIAIVLTIGEPNMFVNGIEQEIDPGRGTVPVIVNSRTLMPIRAVVESLGAEIFWDDAEKKVTIKDESKLIEMWINKKEMNVNGNEVVNDVAPIIINARTFLPLRFVSETLGYNVGWDDSTKSASVFQNTQDPLVEEYAEIEGLPVIGDLATLKKLLPETQKTYYGSELQPTAGPTVEAAPMPADSGRNDTMMSEESSSKTAGGYSETNVQVQGVDEADIIKTDGQYIYQVNRNRVVLINAVPGSQMEVASIIKFNDDSINPQELYIDGNSLVVIGSTYSYIPVFRPYEAMNPIIYPIAQPRNNVKTMVYDITDKTNPVLSRSVEIEGSYISSRKIDESIYIASNKYIYYNMLEDTNESLLPAYKDTAQSEDYISVGLSKIRYFPGATNRSYMTIAGFNIDTPNDQANVSVFLGSGQNLYASKNNLYIVETIYNQSVVYDQPTILKSETGEEEVIREEYVNTENTNIYKFGLNKGVVSFKDTGSVPGRVLNQFSMDENDGYFRIATTKGNMWSSGSNISQNNLYVLDEKLETVGKLEGLAEGERIYSVRFMGDRVYMVTFKQIDPFFVIDLGDPQNPTVLGELKIPGFSTYLHPYDENHVIGFGEENNTMKMSLFDVTNVQKPIEKFKETIGEEGSYSYSELLNNHKTLLYSKELNLLAFPVTIRDYGYRVEPMPATEPMLETDISIEKVEAPQDYQEPTYYQGVYVYGVSLEKGFVFKGDITHQKASDYALYDNYNGNPDKNIQRVLYINSPISSNPNTTVLYTLSNNMVKANAFNTLEEINEIYIPLPERAVKEHFAKQNEIVSVKLYEDNSGYKWHYKINNQQVLALQSEESEKPDATSTGIVPEGKNRIWNFKALAKGSAKVTFELYKDLEGPAKKIDTREYLVWIDEIPTIDTYDRLKEILNFNGQYYYPTYGVARGGMDAAVGMAVPEAAPSAEKGAGGTGSDYSTTNIQVEGVDESDIVKTDGMYIYQVSKQKVVVVSAQNPETMKVESSIKFDNSEFTPAELYIDGDRMIVIGRAYNELPIYRSVDGTAEMAVMPYYRYSNSVIALVYDITDRTNIKKLREVEVEGNYISSRKINNSIYLVANRYLGGNIFRNDQESVLPAYRDSAVDESYNKIGLDEIAYFPGSQDYNYLITAGFNINTPGNVVDVSAYLGSGQNVYVSPNNMYVVRTQYNYDNAIYTTQYKDNESTQIYKFGLNNGTLNFSNFGSVSGRVLNQFSMDENNDYFRIATTKGNNWRTEEKSSSNLYVLDSDLRMHGKVEQIAPGESIYSVRFMGDRAYMVTFERIDPLFVFDLKDPANPVIVGKLKIPGYSDYLHPYDENHIIGFGKETYENQYNSVIPAGLKVALFDITDVNNPVEKYKISIGDQGTHSELLSNHKALLFSKEKDILAFPVNLMEYVNKTSLDQRRQYTDMTFQGAYVYSLTLENGFILKDRITHIEQDNTENLYNYRDNYVQRILYIGDTLYTVSNGMIKSNNIQNMQEINSININ